MFAVVLNKTNKTMASSSSSSSSSGGGGGVGGAAAAAAAVDDLEDPDLKIILLGDSAVGKSKLVERYLCDEYNPRQLSTYALTLFRKEVMLDAEGEGGEGEEGNSNNKSSSSSKGTKTKTTVDFWDTAGQESFNRMHPSYYYRAHCCILLFDVTRKITYQHLTDWYKELREYCDNIPVVLVANKIDVDYNVTRKEFKFASKHNLPFFFVSAADGTNVVKVRCGVVWCVCVCVCGYVRTLHVQGRRTRSSL